MVGALGAYQIFIKPVSVCDDGSSSSAQYLFNHLSSIFACFSRKTFTIFAILISPEREAREGLRLLQITGLAEKSQNFWLKMKCKGVLVLWWEARLYPA